MRTSLVGAVMLGLALPPTVGWSQAPASDGRWMIRHVLWQSPPKR